MRLALIVSYISHAYILLIGILLTPIYFRYLGAEGFGLVGFYVMLQGWIPILDIGLSPVLAREMSRFRAGVINAREAATRLRTLEVICGAIATLVVIALWLGSNWIGEKWLSAATLRSEALARCVVLIAGAVALRWFAGIQRAVLVGLEHQSMVNVLSVGFASLRFIGVLPVVVYISNSPEHFFAYQVMVGGLELIVFAAMAHSFVPGTKGVQIDFGGLMSMLPMVGSMAFLTIIWVVVTQVDKLILSGMLSLEDYAYYSLATMAANGVLVLAGPVNQVIQPRLTILVQKGDKVALAELYQLISQLVVVGFVSFGGGLAFFAEPILLIWTGSKEVAIAAAPMLFWYGLANSVVGILMPPFMLQFAIGQLKLHLIGNLILLVTLVPALIIATQQWGGLGAGRVFFVANLLFLLIWTPLVHRKFLPILKWSWPLRDVLPTALVVLLVLRIGAGLFPDGGRGGGAIVFICGVVIFSMILGIVVAHFLRSAYRKVFEVRD